MHVFTLTYIPFATMKLTFTKDDEFILKIALLLMALLQGNRITKTT
jgi:hypothetical protein